MSTNEAQFKISADDATRQAFESANKHLEKLDKNTDKLTHGFRSLSKSGSEFKSILGGVISVAGAWGVKDQIAEQIRFADALGNTADKLGLTTDELQEYRYAAARNNIEQTAIDTGMQRWIRRLGEAARGQGDLKNVLEENNINIHDSNGGLRDSNVVLADYADAIKNAKTDQEKLLLAFKAFDTEGVAMVNMLRDGAGGLNKLRQEARDTGVVLDESLIRRAQIIDDKWGQVTDALATRFRALSISFASLFVDTDTDRDKLEHQLKQYNNELKRMQESGSNWVYLKELFGGNQQEAINKTKNKIAELEQKLKDLNDQNGRSINSDGTEGSSNNGNDPNKDTLDSYANQHRLAEALQQLHEQNRLQVVQDGLDAEANARRFAHAKMLQDMETAEAVSAEVSRQHILARVGYMGDIVGNLSTLMSSTNERVWRLGKLAAISSAVINTSLAITKTMASVPYPWNIPLAAAQGVAGMVQVQNIRAQQFSGSRVHGGAVSAGGLYKVNDGAGNAVELFRPNSSGQIINNKTVNSGGDRNVNLTVNLHPDSQISNWVDNNQGKIFGVVLSAMRENGMAFN